MIDLSCNGFRNSIRSGPRERKHTRRVVPVKLPLTIEFGSNPAGFGTGSQRLVCP